MKLFELNLTDEQLNNFWDKVATSNYGNTCWFWQASTTKDGYGTFRVGMKIIKAHRISYFLHYGTFDDKLYVLHSCDNPACVNPKHLFIGTQFDNMQDMSKKGRCDNKGEKNGRAILNKEDVSKIRELHKSKKYKNKELANMFGVALVTIEKIVANKLWK